MWLQLSAALAQEAAAPVVPEAVGAQLDVYSDEGITAWAPSARARLKVGASTTVGALWSADFVSGATPVVATDAVSAATPFEETRHGGTLDLTHAATRTWTLNGAATGSTESDHQVLLGSGGATANLFDDHTRLSAGASLGWVKDGTRADPGLAGESVDSAVDLGWTQVLGRLSSATLRLTAGYANCDERFGCSASAYRYVPQGGVFLPERHPAERARLASSVSLAQSLGHDFALHGNYRFYADSWQVVGHTGGLALARGLLSGRALTRVEGRAVQQSAAAFWRDGYGSPTDYRTADRELSGFTEYSGSLRLRWNLFGALRTERVALDAHLSRLWFFYPDYAALSERNAWVAGGGVDVRW